MTAAPTIEYVPVALFGGLVGLTEILARFSATLFMRSSLFNVRVGDTDIQTGPAGVMNTIPSIADRAYDRLQARNRGKAAGRIMKDVAFEKAMTALPALCFQMMQYVTEAEQTAIGEVVASLRADRHMDDRAKSLALGLALISITGEEVLEEAVNALSNEDEA